MVGCTNQGDVEPTIRASIRTAIAAIPTPTPFNFPTPLPTATPVTFLPTPTPITFPATATPVTFPPTATPVTFPPTPTPMTLPPTATPVTFPPTPTPMTPIPTATPTAFVDFNSIYLLAMASVFYIETRSGSGAGWLIDEGFILTNEHVVAGYSTVIVRRPEYPPFKARVVRVNRKKDIALLQFEPLNEILSQDTVPLTMGEIGSDDIASFLLALGYSGATVYSDGTVKGPSANLGVLSQVIDFGRGGLNLEMDAPVDPGDSGGPVLNSDGEVVGMVRAIRVATNTGKRVVGTFYAVHVDEIREELSFLDTNN